MWHRFHTSLGRLALLGPCVIGCALLVASCGKTGTASSDDAAGGSVGGSAKAGSSMGMSGGGVAMTAGGRTGDSGASTGVGGSGGGGGGGGATAGAGSGVTAGAGGATLGEAGAGGSDPLLGVDCRDSHCAPGDVCVVCGMPDGSEWRCVPHPVTQPEAYQTATASCEPAPFNYSECDGPEDCPANQYCVAKDGADGRQRCRSTPAAGSFCCFTCNAGVNCTLCRDDRDCAENEACGIVFESLKGCTRK